VPSPFLAGLTVSFPMPSPGVLRNRVHPLVRFTPLQSAPIPNPLRDLAISERLPWGYRPSSRHQPAASLPRGPTLVAFRPRRFARPRRLDPLLALRVYFAPLPRPGFYPSGIFPPGTAEPVRHRSVPSRRLAAVACERLPARASFHRPALRALSAPRIRCAYASVTRRSARFPPGLAPPPGSPSPYRREHSHAPFRS